MSKAGKDKGPRPVEIAIAAVLSLILGVVGAAVFLAFQEPEEVVGTPPEEDRVFGVVYYVPPSMGNQAHATWQVKQTAVQQGRSGTIPLVAEELNQWAARTFPESDEEGGDKPAIHVSPGTPGFRMEEGVFHVSMPLEWSAFGASREFLGQAHGGFAEENGVHVFDYERVYIGSMPVPGILGLSDMVVNRVASAFEVSDELREGWAGLESVTVEEETLQLTIP